MSYTIHLNKKKKHSREYHLLRKYGITVDEYNELLQGQRESCGVCKRHYSKFKNRLCVDHDHTTGEIRGLLCTFCNRRVIGRHRDPELFRAAYEYLSKGTGLFVPIRVKKYKRKRRKG